MSKSELIQAITQLLDKADDAQKKSLQANEIVYHRAEKETLVKVLEICKELDN